MKETKRIKDFFIYDFLCFKRIMTFVNQDIQKEIFNLLDRTFSESDFLNDKTMQLLKIQWLVTEKSSYLNQKFPEIIKTRFKEEIKD